MLSLQAALSFPKVGDHPCTIADHLHLDVAGIDHQLLGIDVAPAERRTRLGLAAFVGGGDVGNVRDRSHAPATAAGDGLEHHGAVGRHEGLGLGDRGQHFAADEHRHTDLGGQDSGSRLVTEEPQRPRRGPHERDAGGLDGGGKVGVLAQESVTGVDGVASVLACDGDQLLDVEVGGRAPAAQLDGLIGLGQMKRGRVISRSNGHRLDSQFGRSAQNTARDLATVGDQEFAQRCSTGHGASVSQRPTTAPNGTNRCPLGNQPPVSGSDVGLSGRARGSRYRPRSTARNGARFQQGHHR